MNTIISTKALRIFACGLALIVSLGALVPYCLDLTADNDTKVAKILHLTTTTPKTPVLLVTIQDLGSQTWPWSSLDYAVFLNSVAPYRPALVAITVPLQEGDTDYHVYDIQLGKQIRHLNRVILSGQALRSNIDTTSPKFPDPLLGNAPGLIFNVPRAEAPPPSILSNAGLGLNLLTGNTHQLMKKIPLVVGYQNQLYPTFVLQVYAEYLSADWSKSVCTSSEIILRSSFNREVARIPIDREGCFTIHYQPNVFKAPAPEFYQIVVSAEQIRNNFPPIIDLAQLTGSVILIGTETPGTFQPVYTDTGPVAPVRVLYQALVNLFTANFVHPAGVILVTILLLLLTQIASRFALWKHLGHSTAGLLALLLVILGIGVLLVFWLDILLPFSLLWIACILTWVLTALLYRLNHPNPNNPYKSL